MQGLGLLRPLPTGSAPLVAHRASPADFYPSRVRRRVPVTAVQTVNCRHLGGILSRCAYAIRQGPQQLDIQRLNWCEAGRECGPLDRCQGSSSLG